MYYIFSLSPIFKRMCSSSPARAERERAEWLSSDYHPLGHYLVTLWRDDWNDTTCDTTRPRDKLARERETKEKGLYRRLLGIVAIGRNKKGLLINFWWERQRERRRKLLISYLPSKEAIWLFFCCAVCEQPVHSSSSSICEFHFRSTELSWKQFLACSRESCCCWWKGVEFHRLVAIRSTRLRTLLVVVHVIQAYYFHVVR